MKKTLCLLFTVATVAACSPKPSIASFRGLPENEDPVVVGKKIAELFLTADPLSYKPEGCTNSKGMGNNEYVMYATASLWVNSMEFARFIGDSKLESKLITKFEPFYGEKKEFRNRSNHVDFSIFGAIPLEIYLLSSDQRARSLGLEYADKQWSEPDSTDLGGNGNFEYARQMKLLAEGYSPQTRLWIDDMYMINVLQTQAYRATGDRKYIDRAAKEMIMYIDSLQLDNGLFYHAPDVPFVWGRGDGWMAAGMPMILKFLEPDSEYYEPIKNGYLKMMTSLLQYQRESGLWGQLITDPDIWEESSCSAMFAYGFIEGIKHGWLDEKTYGPAARKAWSALCAKLDSLGNISEVCGGTNRKNSREWYEGRKRYIGDPHGQCAMMWICGSLISE